MGHGVKGKLFKSGAIVTTAGVHRFMDENPKFASFVIASLMRHIRGDWGDLEMEDQFTNETALNNGYRLFSRYNLPEDITGINEKTIYIITEADRSSTCILFPSEY